MYNTLELSVEEMIEINGGRKITKDDMDQFMIGIGLGLGVLSLLI